MTTDKSTADIDYTSALARASGTLIVRGNATGYSTNGWNSAINAAGLDTPTFSTHVPTDISGYSLIIDSEDFSLLWFLQWERLIRAPISFNLLPGCKRSQL